MGCAIMNIHDRARALSLSSGMTINAAYSVFSRRSTAVRQARAARKKSSLDRAAEQVASTIARFPYAD